MISFDFRLALKLLRKSFFPDPTSDARLTRKRLWTMVLLFTFYVINQSINGISLFLDEIFFPDYHKVLIKEPVFVVGFPRSGTTYIHRLLALDGQFTTIRLWEILFAPSICQKKLFRKLGRLDDQLGSPISSRILKWEQKKLNNVYHAIGLFEPEEDEAMMMHIFSSFFLIFMFPFYQDLRPLARFDVGLPLAHRRRIMEFYKRCIQRHMFVFGKNDEKFLSKNPVFSTRIQSIMKTFPDAHFLYMVRNPLEAIPSEINQRYFFAHNFYSPVSSDSIREYVLDMAGDYYRYPLSRLPDIPDSRQAVIQYPCLVSNPQSTIKNIYIRFGFTFSKSFEVILNSFQKEASSYRSYHQYSLEKVGLDREKILYEFKDIFDSFSCDGTNQNLNREEASLND